MKDHKQRSSILFILGWLLYLLVLLMVVPTQWTEGVIDKERDMIRLVYGETTAQWVDGKVGDWYGRFFNDTGVKSAMYGYFDFTEADRQSSTFKGFGDSSFDYFRTVLNRFFLQMELLLQRWAQLQLWLLPLLLAWVPLLMDGYVRWKIRRTKFSFASPVLFGYALKATSLLVMVTVMVSLLPWALPPALLPLLLFGGCILVWMAFGQMQKRL